MYALSIPMATWHYVGEMEYMQLSPKFSSASYYLKPFSLSSEICLHFLKMWIVLAVFFPKMLYHNIVLQIQTFLFLIPDYSSYPLSP